MNNNLHQIVAYTRFLFKSKNRHAVHSPFVYEMSDKVLRPDKKLEDFISIERERKQYLTSDEILDVNDLGAGSRSGMGSARSIKKIAKYSLSSPHQCRLMYRIATYYQPNIILELGTSLGISTAYLGMANEESLVYTFEGSESIFHQAEALFSRLSLDNIQPILGDFDLRLPEILDGLPQVDMAFIDGNHTYQGTTKYFHQILEKSHNDTIIIVDDIHWSKEMNRAWEHIQSHERTTTTIDLFYFGIVLLREEMSKEHFVLRY